MKYARRRRACFGAPTPKLRAPAVRVLDHFHNFAGSVLASMERIGLLFVWHVCWCGSYSYLFKSAPHISPGALCAASDPMAIQPDSGFPDEGISFVHKAEACQPDPFPLRSFLDYSKDSLK